MNNKTKPKAARPMKITAHFVISRHRLGFKKEKLL